MLVEETKDFISGMGKLLAYVRLLISFILWFLAFYYFGLSSYRAYRDEATIFVEKKVKYDDSRKPTITIRKSLKTNGMHYLKGE